MISEVPSGLRIHESLKPSGEKQNKPHGQELKPGKFQPETGHKLFTLR